LLLPSLPGCDGVKASQQQVQVYKEQIQTLKGTVSCPNCGAEVSSGSAFCNVCGTKIEHKVPKASAGRICPVCGASVPESLDFFSPIFFGKHESDGSHSPSFCPQFVQKVELEKEQEVVSEQPVLEEAVTEQPVETDNAVAEETKTEESSAEAVCPYCENNRKEFTLLRFYIAKETPASHTENRQIHVCRRK